MYNRIERKRQKEQQVVEKMIFLYCRQNHAKNNGYNGRWKRGDADKRILCGDCQKLADYAKMRSEKCPFMEHKTFCSNCKVHCYQPYMREKIRQVMRFSGPRMILYHPILAVWHLVCSIKEKRRSGHPL